MKWLGIAIAVVVALVGIMALIGAMMPQNHEASRSAVISVPPDSVWRIITDFTAAPQWRKDLTSVERLPDQQGRPAWREHGRNGDIAYEAVEWVPPSRFQSRISDTKLAFGGSWTFDLVPESAGRATRVTITERGEVYNPIFRFLSRFVFGYTATLDAYLGALEQRANPGVGDATK
jgi:uncharacterized protein YndB with AHSA1/START domain